MKREPSSPQPLSRKKPTLLHALAPVFLMILFLGAAVLKYHSAPHIPLIFGSLFASLSGLSLGYRWSEIEEGIVHAVAVALQPCLILMVIGVLIGSWIVGGIVPTMIYYGLKLLSPAVFLPTVFIICSLVSLATGSSWSTAGTVGIALIGVGHGLGVPLPMTAGAIVSGAYFGDKMSPLSDTTNLAPAVAGTDLFTHIRHMVYTTGASTIFSLILYTGISLFSRRGAIDSQNVALILNTLQNNFVISPLFLIPALLVIAMVIFRVPALPSLVGGALLGMISALVFQKASLGDVLEAAQSGFSMHSGVQAVDELLSRGGLESMLPTVALILCALSFGGILERTGLLQVIAEAILKTAKSVGSLVTATVLSTIVMNIIAPDQYLSIVVPGRMYRKAYEEKGLALQNLSRALEDGGTLSSPLIPWNTCGAYMAATLGVHPFLYLPFAFLNLINPLVSIIYGFTGVTMVKAAPSSQK
ncbi:MAG: Na+/H+ antiporter NhaC [candidate division KSB1 bacterium]|nr:Na+/H+ antiporter NhaC [candidate division KSB1 bacterium]MDZ7345801.1 Na+/H+ antiporter NhaC [candidate division KSB1 bacterium]